MDEDFDTRQLPSAPDAVAPDGSDVRVLLQLGRGSMAHFELAASQVSRAVAHRSVDEIWYVLHGHGQMWRRQEDPLDENGEADPAAWREHSSVYWADWLDPRLYMTHNPRHG